MAGVDHFNEFLSRLYQLNDYESGRVFDETDIFTGPSDLDENEIPYFLQLYGEYILGLVKGLFPNWPFPLGAFIQISMINAYYEEQYSLVFATSLPINDETYEVVLEKREFIDGRVAKSKTDFNRKTSQLVAAIASRLNNLGSDDDRKLGIALPIS